jgi:AMMECR1 domain-containing protein
MESAKKRRVVATFPWRALRAPLSDDERTELRRDLERLVRWQARLGAFPRIERAPDATPFVSIYARGKLRGCFGSEEGSPPERLCRAFLRAMEDVRFGSVAPDERPLLAAQVSYPIDPEAHDAKRIVEHLELGAHGIACVREGTMPVNLLPQVARDHGFDALRFMDQLALKAGTTRAKLASSHLFSFRTEDVVARQSPAPAPFGDPALEGRVWLAQLVGSDGRVDFAIDPRAGQRHPSGPMRHGRAAVALRALAHSKSHARPIKRGLGWLASDIARALRGDRIEGWPDDPAVVAGTLALVFQAGVDVRSSLIAHAARPELAKNPWHAAQVICALGRQSPPALFRACVADLERRPWAPWTALAARELGDARVLARCERSLIASLRSSPPHQGGAAVTAVPEIALTAIAIEALAGLESRTAEAAVARGRSFLRRWQIATPNAALDPALARGAFPASPVVSLLRCDVTGHAVLALMNPPDGK